MPLYVIRPPDPPVGTDWTATVPGQYLYDVTGITANLDSNTGDPATAIDSSGAGNDLAYTPGDVVFGIAGYVTTDFMVQNTHFGSSFTAEGTVDPSNFVGQDLFFNVWTDEPPFPGSAPAYVSYAGAASGLSFFCDLAGPPGSAGLHLRWTNVGDPLPKGCIAIAPFGAGRHMISARLDIGAGGAQFYLDGAPFGAFAVASGAMPDLDATSTLRIGGGGTLLGSPHFDEIAIGLNPSVDADFANLFALRGNFANYTSAQIAMGPEYYYHLDETGVGTGRQVLFEITDGSDTVGVIPTGFATSTDPGPFAYSWQPKLGAGAQTLNGITTTVPIPKLILPAGYTLGTRTLDLGAVDQWSDIVIWWDSALMDSINGPGAYEYPPGVHLVYKQVTDAG